jgi:transcriptional regulator with XRE-family HTH domain
MMALPNRIRELRKARDWKLEDLADRLDCSIPQVSDLERGNRELTYHWMKRLAKALACEPADLLLPEDNSGSLTVGERELIDRYRAGSDDQRAQVDRMAEIIIPDEAEARAAA